SPPSTRVRARSSARRHRLGWTTHGQPMTRVMGRPWRCGSVELRDVRAEGVELAHEVLVAAVDDVDAAHPRGALGGERRDEVGEAATEVGDLDVGRLERRRAGDDGRVVEVAVPEA